MIKEIKYKSHDEWLSIRRQYIGGSDASAVLGRNPYRSAYELWAEKSGKIQAFEGNLTTEVGAYLEELVARLFERETGKKVRKKNAVLVNSRYPWSCANIDRAVVGEDAILEIKTTTSVPIMRQLKGQDFPDAYYCQCVHYLAVTQKKKCYLAVLIQNRELKIYELEYDPEEIDALMTAEAEFMDLIKQGTPPEPDGTESSASAISELYPREDEAVECDVSALELDLQKCVEYAEAIKTLETERRKYQNRIKDYMKDAARGSCERFSVSYTSAVRRSFEADRFAADHPDIDLGKYYKESTSRTLRISQR